MSVETVAFKPSQIDPFRKSIGNRVQVSACPFVATFRHAESEVFAAMIVGAMAMHNDDWTPIEPKQIGMWLKMRTGEERRLWESLTICRPHPHELVKEGWCRFIGDNTDDKGAPIEFTESGLEKLAVWVRQ